MLVAEVWIGRALVAAGGMSAEEVKSALLGFGVWTSSEKFRRQVEHGHSLNWKGSDPLYSVLKRR